MSAIQRITKLAAVGAGATAILSAALTSGGSAATAGSTSVETAANQHCVADLNTGSMTCFKTAQEADSFGNTRQAATALAWQVHVILYANTGYSGASIRLGSDGQCSATTTDVDGVQPNLGNFGWSNRASSFVTRNQCDMKAWDLTNYRGDHFSTYRDHDIALTALNNRISSFKTS